MNLISMIFRALAVLGALAAAALFLMVRGEVSDKQEALEDARSALENTQAEVARLESEVQDVQSTLTLTEGDLEEARRRTEELQIDNRTVRQELNKVRRELRDTEQRVASLEERNEQLVDEIRRVESQPSPQPDSEELERLRTRLAEAQRQLEQYERQGVAMTNRDRGGATGGATGNLQDTGEITSQVAGLSRNAGLVVLTAGSNAGIQSEQEYTLKRGDFTVARVRIQRLENDHTVAAILPNQGFPEALSAGDEVTIVQ